MLDVRAPEPFRIELHLRGIEARDVAQPPAVKLQIWTGNGDAANAVNMYAEAGIAERARSALSPVEVPALVPDVEPVPCSVMLYALRAGSQRKNLVWKQQCAPPVYVSTHTSGSPSASRSRTWTTGRMK